MEKEKKKKAAVEPRDPVRGVHRRAPPHVLLDPLHPRLAIEDGALLGVGRRFAHRPRRRAEHARGPRKFRACAGPNSKRSNPSEQRKSHTRDARFLLPPARARARFQTRSLFFFFNAFPKNRHLIKQRERERERKGCGTYYPTAHDDQARGAPTRAPSHRVSFPAERHDHAVIEELAGRAVVGHEHLRRVDRVRRSGKRESEIDTCACAGDRKKTSIQSVPSKGVSPRFISSSPSITSSQENLRRSLVRAYIGAIGDRSKV